VKYNPACLAPKPAAVVSHFALSARRPGRWRRSQNATTRTAAQGNYSGRLRRPVASIGSMRTRAL